MHMNGIVRVANFVKSAFVIGDNEQDIGNRWKAGEMPPPTP